MYAATREKESKFALDLGALNDVTTREKLAAEAALSANGAADSEDARQRAFATGTQEAHTPALLDAAERAHAKFKKAKPFWA